MVIAGTKWSSNDGKTFRVLNRVEVEGNVWIHYIRNDVSDELEHREYSCYEESFVSRFVKIPE